MSKLAWRVLCITAVILFSMTLGILVGVWAGANFAENFQFDDVLTYTSTGYIGLIFGLIALLLVSAYYWVKGKNPE